MPAPSHCEHDAGAPRVLRQVQLAVDCVRLKRQGKSYREIGLELGISHTCARNHVVDWMRHAMEELKEQHSSIVALHVSRTEHYLDSLGARIERGDTRAIEVALKVLERQARLLGLDAPVKVEQRVEVLELTDDELREEERRLGTLPAPPPVPALLPGESSVPPALVLDAEIVGELPPPQAQPPQDVSPPAGESQPAGSNPALLTSFILT